MTLAEVPLWLSNLAFWSAQVAVLVLAAGFLPRLFRIYQPRVLLVYWRTLLVTSLLLPFVEPWHRVESIASLAIAPEIDVTHVVTPSSPALSRWNLTEFSNHRSDSGGRDSRWNRRAIRDLRAWPSKTSPVPENIFSTLLA